MRLDPFARPIFHPTIDLVAAPSVSEAVQNFTQTTVGTERLRDGVQECATRRRIVWIARGLCGIAKPRAYLFPILKATTPSSAKASRPSAIFLLLFAGFCLAVPIQVAGLYSNAAVSTCRLAPLSERARHLQRFDATRRLVRAPASDRGWWPAWLPPWAIWPSLFLVARVLSLSPNGPGRRCSIGRESFRPASFGHPPAHCAVQQRSPYPRVATSKRRPGDCTPRDHTMRNISDTIRRLRAHPLSMPQGSVAKRADRLTGLPEFGTNPGMLRARIYTPANLADNAPLVVVLHGCTQFAVEYDRGFRLVDSRRFTWVRCALPRAAARQQRQSLLQLVRARRYPPRLRRGAVDPPDGRGDSRCARHRSQPHLRDRPFGRRRHGVGNACHLSRCIRRGRNHSWDCRMEAQPRSRKRSTACAAMASRRTRRCRRCYAALPAMTGRGRRSLSGMVLPT